ncbi:uncharacterized protein [Euwallacea similis]|uniref:uncharacterized protein n=1 Tax=Euwallacea similis TaxID=1736056 RepID=UPI00344EDAF7
MELGSAESLSENDEFRELLHARRILTKRLSRFEQYLRENRDIQETVQLEIRLKNVEEDYNQFDKVQSRLEFLSLNEEEQRIEIESAYFNLISELKQLINSISKNQNSTNTHLGKQNSPRGLGKLPDLGLRSFYGNYETWFSFKNIFDSLVHSRTDLSETEKLLYLKLCCKGDALNLIDSLDITPDNYTIALNLLQKRYENKKAVINIHAKGLVLNLPNANKGSSVNIRKLIDAVQQHKSSLGKLKLPVDQWDVLLIPIILNKLDDSTNQEWERKQCNTELPTVDQLMEFLTEKCRSLEAVRGFSTVHSNKHDRDRMQNKGHEKRNESHQFKNYSYSLTEKINKCYICTENHFIHQCPRFIQLSVSDKYNEIRRHKLCSNCLRPGHLKQECRSRGCKKCNQKHNSTLHIEKRSGSEHVQNSSNSSTNEPSSSLTEHESSISSPSNPSAHDVLRRYGESKQSTVLTIGQSNAVTYDTENNPLALSSLGIDKNQVLLSTATILISDRKGNWHKCNALLDCGSQSNLMTENFCRKLNLSPQTIDLSLSGISQIVTKINQRVHTKIKSRFNQYESNIAFLVLPILTENLPSFRFPSSVLQIPTNINLADEKFNEPKQIDVLLGVDIFYNLLGSGKLKLGKGLPMLQETSLGWVISGNLICRESQSRKVVCNLATSISNKTLNDSLTKFWQIEEFENVKFLSKEENYCEEYFNQTTTRDMDNSFVVRYPFNNQTDFSLGDSKSNALKRLKNVEKRLEKDKDLKKQYVEFMTEYENLGHMTLQGPIEKDISIPNNSYFLPHSAVLKNSITTKCRVVFDASCKTSLGISLNDTLLVGPVVQDDLYSILIRLRLRKIVLSADIKMMYRCIKIHEEERNFQKILWRANLNDPINVYKLNTVTYGTSSAPFQATRCLIELAERNKDRYPRTAEIIKRSFYMDDLLVSIDSETDALQIYRELDDILSQANFKLRKWSSNSNIVLNSILQANSNENHDNLILPHEDKHIKTLGISWDPKQDTLKYSVNIKYEPSRVTKRTILSKISQIFDPLGLIGPALTKAKLIIQALWKLHIGWDQVVPNDLRQIWEEFSNELECLNEYKIDRLVIPTKTAHIRLYGFSDSSEKAYGACIYVASEDESGSRELRLLTGKSRVAPAKKLTLPRLELLAAHLLAKLMNTVRQILDIQISDVRYFTDSSIVLAWLKIDPAHLKTFVANRVAKINELTKITEWAHVPSKANPADVISRGLSPRELLGCDLWFHGPEFLKKNTSRTEANLDSHEVPVDVLPELKNNHTTVYKTTSVNSNNYGLNIFDRFSTFFKLHRVVGYICRLKNRCRKVMNKSTALTVEELNESLLLLVKLVQRDSFEKEISDLSKSKKLPSETNHLIKWHFIPARSAHMGGLWEAAVKSTKFHLRRVLGESSLTYEEMYTLLVKIEACLNSRPLMPISNDINDYAPLTPAHFLIGDSLASLPQPDYQNAVISRLSHYERLQQLQQHFWNSWSRDYLTNLQTRCKWKNTVDKTIDIGALVLLVEHNTAPLRWILARVVELHEGKDHVIRVVSVRLPSGTISRRSLSKICPLPMNNK